MNEAVAILKKRLTSGEIDLTGGQGHARSNRMNFKKSTKVNPASGGVLRAS